MVTVWYSSCVKFPHENRSPRQHSTRRSSRSLRFEGRPLNRKTSGTNEVDIFRPYADRLYPGHRHTVRSTHSYVRPQSHTLGICDTVLLVHAWSVGSVVARTASMVSTSSLEQRSKSEHVSSCYFSCCRPVRPTFVETLSFQPLSNSPSSPPN